MDRLRVNYIYFGFFLALLLLTSAMSVFARDNLAGSRIFFLIYAWGQAILEIALFVFLGVFIRRVFGSIWFTLFTGFTFLIFICHALDFVTERLLDLSVYETLFIFVLGETFEQFFYLLDASGVPSWAWMFIFAGLGLVPLIGIGIYQAADFLSKKRPLKLKPEWLFQTFVCVPFALFLWDFSASKAIHPDAYTDFTKSLPWKVTFMQPQTVRIPLQSPLSSHLNVALENDIQLKAKPNIYLFIAESLREDVITDEIAPHLAKFKKENIAFDLALSNANCTNIAWFSIFHSQLPFYWNQIEGSAPLAILKKWGYQIRVISSAQLAYFNLEKILFGNDLLDGYATYHHAPPISAAMSDSAVVANLRSQIEENPSLQQGQVFIIFLDSTHFDYSWPKEKEPKFSPIASELTYFKAFTTFCDLEPLKNRYRNAVHHVDSLFGDFMTHLPRADEAIVIFTGDHGEEFLEHGHLFHGSHLNREQTHIPLYFKFGSNTTLPVSRKFISQVDIFPSILDYLSHSEFPFRGKSMFRETANPYAVIARFNANRLPYEFCIHSSDSKLRLQFSRRSDIFSAKELKIRSVSTIDDQIVMEFEDNIHEWIESNFGSALKQL